MLLLRKLYDNPGVCTPEKDRWYKYPWMLTLLVNEVQILLVVNQLSRDVIGWDTMTVKSRLVCFNSSLSLDIFNLSEKKKPIGNINSECICVPWFCHSPVVVGADVVRGAWVVVEGDGVCGGTTVPFIFF